MKPRVLLIGRNRYRLPLDPSLQRKFDALDEVAHLRVLGTSLDGERRETGRFHLLPSFPVRKLDGFAFYLSLPYRLAKELRRFRPDAVLTQSPYEAAAALLARAGSRVPARIVLEVHGDWRTLTRLYGSPLRRLVRPAADGIAALAVRRADAVRTVSPYTTRIVREQGVEPAAVFPAFMDLEPFLVEPPVPLPERPVALFVGVLEQYKNVDGLASAWRLAAPNVPDASLRIVGRGTRSEVVEGLLRDLPQQTEWTRELPTAEIVRALDDATVLVLPSRSEGMGRVVVEALCRGRGVIGGRVGGIVDLVRDGENGLLVEPDDPADIADALVRMLSDRALAERLSSMARPSVESWLRTPEEYARSIAAVVGSS